MHGDLDMSEIDQLPACRKPIITEIVRKKTEAHKLIKTELNILTKEILKYYS